MSYVGCRWIKRQAHSNTRSSSTMTKTIFPNPQLLQERFLLLLFQILISHDLACLDVNDNHHLIFGPIHPWRNIHPSPISYLSTLNLSWYGQWCISFRIRTWFIWAPSQNSLHLKMIVKINLSLGARGMLKANLWKAWESLRNVILQDWHTKRECFRLIYSMLPWGLVFESNCGLVWDWFDKISRNSQRNRSSGRKKANWTSHCRGQDAAVTGRREGDNMTHTAPENCNFFVPFSCMNALSDSSPKAGQSNFHYLKSWVSLVTNLLVALTRCAHLQCIEELGKCPGQTDGKKPHQSQLTQHWFWGTLSCAQGGNVVANGKLLPVWMRSW